MKLDNMAKGGLLDLAFTATDSKLLRQLSYSNDSNVRRAVARNRNTTAEILFDLAYDPVLNVCYMAIQNPKCTVNRVLDSSHPCVSCEIDERTMNCLNCIKLENLYS